MTEKMQAKSYQVIHVRRDLRKDTIVDRPFYFVRCVAVVVGGFAIVNMKIVIYKANVLRPFEDLRRPI